MVSDVVSALCGLFADGVRLGRIANVVFQFSLFELDEQVLHP